MKKINKHITFNHYEFIQYIQSFREDIDKIITINVQSNFSTYINNVYELLLNHYYIIIINCWCYEEILFIINELKKNNINDLKKINRIVINDKLISIKQKLIKLIKLATINKN